MLVQGFKKYNRGRRAQLSEEKFNRGMKFTNTPLLEGFSKILVNYDLQDAGEALAPRNGLKTYRIGLPPKETVSGSTVISYNTVMSLMAGQICTELDNREYNQIIIGQPSNTLITETDLYQGQTYISTVYPENESYESATAIPDDLTNEIESREIHIDNAVSNSATEYTVFKKPDKAQIHGMSLLSVDKIARQIGTFAFNNSYYCFKRKVSDGTNKLMYTKLIELAQSNPKRYTYKTQELTPRALTSKEAVLWGYNMLLADPFTFANTNGAGNVLFYGMLPYDAAGKLLMSPQQNQDITFKCNYGAQIGVKYTFVWEWKETGATNWISLGSEIRTIADTSALSKQFSAPTKDIMVRISAYRWSGDPLIVETVTEQTLIVGFNFNKDTYGSTANIAIKNYDLSKSSGMSYWKNRLIVWQDNMMFASEVNNPEYFPYPNNAEIFEEPIMHAMVHLDNFLVFTTTKIYMLSLNADGLGWTKKCIQNNLAIQEWDIHLIKPVKNMVFFKSGNYYYMIVPSRSSTGELVIAPISKEIEGLFDNFQSTITELLKMIYDYSGTIQLVHYYNFLDYEDVHNVYVFQTEKDVYVNCALLYNTVSRSWRTHFTESQNIIMPFKQDATKKGILMTLTPVTIGASSMCSIQFLQYTKSDCADFYVPNNLIIASEDPVEKLSEFHFFKNYQMIDTGYREHASDFKKRYRETQFKINNISQESLNFYTDFLVDGDLRKTTSKYIVHHDIDPESATYGLITMERELVEPLVVPGTTVLAETEDDTNCWTLDVSLFPEAVLWKIRIPISGKGYSPRMRLISFNEQPYEILNTAWVYRSLNSR